MAQHEIERLLPRHFVILDLTLGGNGPREIAQVLGMTPQAITLITKAPIFQHELARRRENLQNRVDSELASIPSQAKRLMEERSLAAAQVHADMIEKNEDGSYIQPPNIVQASANNILDRVFGKGDQAQKQTVVILEPGAIQLLQIALQESQDESPIPVEATVVK